MTRALRAWLLGLLFGALAASPALADPPMWRVRPPSGKPGTEIVLFGSVHLLSPDLKWRSPALDRELAQAHELWFEIPMDGAAQAAAAGTAAKLGKLPAGQTLSQHLGPEARARLARVAGRFGLPAASLETFRPWLAEVTLTLLQLQQQGGRQGSGVEETLSRAAPPSARTRAFETPEQQIRLLAEAPIREQAASLEQTLKEIETDPDAFDELQKAWIDGDTAWLEREAVGPLREASPALYRRLVVERNRRWTQEIERLLKRKESALIVVGVGHLVGADSVPALLRRRGYVVEGP